MSQRSLISILRRRRHTVALALSYVLMLNLFFGILLEFRSADGADLLTAMVGATCLKGGEAQSESGKADLPTKQKSCAVCDRLCPVGGCAPPALWGSAAGLTRPSIVPARPDRLYAEPQLFRSALYESDTVSQAPPTGVERRKLSGQGAGA